jgi:hypothetical protein
MPHSAPHAATDEQIKREIRERARTDRDWALAWSVLQVARAIEALTATKPPSSTDAHFPPVGL